MNQSSINHEESFVTGKPLNPLLRRFISYYYFHEKTKGAPTQFIYYPHVKNGFTIYKNSKTTITGSNTATTPDQSIDYMMLYSGIKTQAIKVSITPPFNKIGVAFQPLGINNFSHEPLSEITGARGSIIFNHFRASLTPVLDNVYAIKSVEEKIKLLDSYFGAQLIGFDEPRLEKAINLLLTTQKKYSVEELAEDIGVSRKTLLRLFNKHLNCSVKDYIHIIQFRKAVKTYQQAKKKIQLGQVAHINNYYDQSDFIKHFKKITGFNPTRFFNDIQHLGSEDTFWTFVK